MVSLKSMKPAARKKALIGVAEEFNSNDFFETDVVTKGKSEDELKKELKDGGELLEKDDVLSEESEAILLELGYLSPEYKKAHKIKDAAPEKPEKKSKKKAEPEPEEEVELDELVNGTKKLAELKDIAESNDEFESLQDDLDGYKGVKGTNALKKAMLACLEEEPEPEKKSKKDKSGKKDKKSKKEPEPEKMSKKERKAVEKAAKEATTKKKEKKTPKKSRMVVICDTVKDLPKKGLSIDKVSEKANIACMDLDGADNEKQTKNTLRVILPVLVEFGIVVVNGDILTPGK